MTFNIWNTNACPQYSDEGYNKRMRHIGKVSQNKSRTMHGVGVYNWFSKYNTNSCIITEKRKCELEYSW